MKTSEQRQEEFMNDLIQLLRKHNASMEVEDEVHSTDCTSPIVVITMHSIYDYVNDKKIAEYSCFKITGTLP